MFFSPFIGCLHSIILHDLTCFYKSTEVRSSQNPHQEQKKSEDTTFSYYKLFIDLNCFGLELTKNNQRNPVLHQFCLSRNITCHSALPANLFDTKKVVIQNSDSPEGLRVNLTSKCSYNPLSTALRFQPSYNCIGKSKAQK